MTKVTIALLTKNAQVYIKEILVALRSQKTKAKIEILAIDSGSRDKTLDFLRKYEVKIHEIKPSEFGHARTRNLAARLAKGSHYIAYLTQDATPGNEYWLQALLDSFGLDNEVAGVFSRHIPRPNCNPILAHQIEDLWPTGSYKRHVKKIKTLNNFKKNIAKYIYFSNTSSCIKRDILIKYPFPEVDFGEDAAWELMVLKAGFSTVFEPSSVVIHSHDYPLIEQLRQHYDHVKGMKSIFSPEARKGISFHSIFSNYDTLISDWKYLQRKNFNFLESLHWMSFALFWHGAAYAGSWLGNHHLILPKFVQELLSRQERIKRGKFK